MNNSVKIYRYSNLPDWVNKDNLPNNGSGKEYAQYLIIDRPERRVIYSTANEPEDNLFSRDLSWIMIELSLAYAEIDNLKEQING